MADPLDARTVKYVEYIDEVTLGTMPTNPTMLAFPGYINSFKFTSGANFDSYTYFKGAADADPLSSGTVSKTGETHAWSCEMKATGLTLLPHALLASTISTYTPGTKLLPVSIGVKMGASYTTLKGCPITSWQMEFPDLTSAASLTIEGMAMDRTDFSGTDYKGTGSHATVPSSAAYTMASLTAVTYDNSAFSAADLSIESLKFGVSNNIEPVLDLGSSLGSKIGSWSFGPREINLELEAKLLGTGAIDDAMDGAAHEVEFTLGSKTFTFTNVIWTNAPDVDCNPEDLIGFSLQADPQAVRLAIA